MVADGGQLLRSARTADRSASRYTTQKRTERLGKATGVRAGERARPDQQGVHRPLQLPRLRGEEPLFLPRRRLRGPGAPQGPARRADPRPTARGACQEGRQEGCSTGCGDRGGACRRRPDRSAGPGGHCADRAARDRDASRRGGARCTGRSGGSADEEGHLVQADQRPPGPATGRAARCAPGPASGRRTRPVGAAVASRSTRRAATRSCAGSAGSSCCSGTGCR